MLIIVLADINWIPMKQNAVLPLVDLPKSIESKENEFEAKQISALFSNNAFARMRAAIWLKENGNSGTANKIEEFLSKPGLPKEVSKEAGRVLRDLSWKNFDFANSIRTYVSRMLTIQKALSLKRI